MALLCQLLKEGAQPDNYRGEYEGTALSRAAWNGHIDIEKILIEAGADVNKQDRDGQTALYRAAWNGHNDIAKILIEAGADVSKQDNDGLTALSKAPWNGHIDIAKSSEVKGQRRFSKIIPVDTIFIDLNEIDNDDENQPVEGEVELGELGSSTTGDNNLEKVVTEGTGEDDSEEVVTVN